MWFMFPSVPLHVFLHVKSPAHVLIKQNKMHYSLKLRCGEVCDHKNLTISAKLCHPQIFCENFRALLQASWLLHSCNCTNTPAGYIEQTCLGMPVTNAMSEFMQQTANQISRSFPILALHRKQTRENPLSEFHILEVFSL